MAAIVQIPSESPLYNALYPQIQSKVTDFGWSNSDDTSLTDFILLTLANGKSQEELSSEIQDLLEESEYDKLPGFTNWLVGEILSSGGPKEVAPSQPPPSGPDAATAQASLQGEISMDAAASGPGENAMDEDMSEVPTGPANGSIPSGPKSMRHSVQASRGGRGGRPVNSAPETTLHRIKGTASTGRINTHSGRDSPRGTPRGPRAGFRNTTGRGGGGMNGVNMQAAQQAAQQPAAAMPAFTPEQQSFVANMMTENMSMLASMFAQQQQQSQMGGGFGMGSPGGGGGRGRGGKSLFDRVEGRKPRNSNDHHQKQQQAQNGESQNGDSIELTSSMEVEDSSQTQQPRPDASTTMCKFNLFCTKPDCHFAHQSAAAPPGTNVDVNDECKFGASCKNRKCAGKHPSPAAGAAQQEPMLCRYFPNCTNPFCTFMHPPNPGCRNGADCTTPNCQYSHNPTPCKFNPCNNPSCQFKHAEGQKQVANRAAAFSRASWVNPELRAGGGADADHKSERKFVDEEVKEEMVIPGAPQQEDGMQAESAEVA